jgi:predicted porin
MCCLAAFILFALPLDMHAGETTLTPQLSIGGRYDNNVLFERTDPIDDYSSVVQPALNLKYKTELSKFELGVDGQFVNYLDRSDMDTVKQSYYMDGNTEISERVRFDANIDYIIDTLLDSELEETGRIFNLEDRERLRAGAGMDYSLSQKSEIRLDYLFYFTDYEEEGRADRTSHAVRTHISGFFNEGIDRLTLLPQYRYTTTTDDIEVNNFSLSLGWTHQSSETGTLRLFAGGRYTEESPTSDNADQDAEKRETSGFIFDFNYDISDEIYSFIIGIRRNINFDADGDLREVNRLYTRYSYSLTERLESGINANVYLTSSEDEDIDEDTRYFDVRPRLDYSLTENHSLRLSYRYSLEYDDTQEYETVTRSQIELSVIFRFPKQF